MRRRILRQWPVGVWAGTILLAVAAFPAHTIALAGSELVLFTDTYFECPDGGKGLYTNKDINDMSAWGFNNQASAYKQIGGWKLYDGFSAQTLLITTATTASSDCDLGSDNDKISSVRD